MPQLTPAADPAAPYGCTYAGIPLAVPGDDVVDWVERNCPAPDVPVSQRPGFPASKWAGLSGIAAPQRRTVRPGCLWWPTGASRFAVGHFFATGNQLKAIYGGTTLSTGPPAYANAREFVMRTAQGEIKTDLFLLPPRPLAGMKSQQPDLYDLYLLTLVDDRFWWWYARTDDINLTDDATTWPALYFQIAANLSLDATTDAVDAGLLNAPKNLRIQYEPPGPALDAAAYSAGQRVVRKLDGKVRFTNWQSDLLTLDQNLFRENFRSWKRVAGGHYSLGYAPNLELPPDPNFDVPLVLPVKFQVAFREYDGTTGLPLATYHLGTVDLAGVDPKFRVGPGGVKAYRTERPDITSPGAMTLYLNALAKSWVYRQLAPVAVRFAGIVPWEPEGLSDSIEWCYRLREAHTTVHRPPWDDGVTELLGPDNGGRGGCTGTINELVSICVTENNNVNTIVTSAATVTADHRNVDADASGAAVTLTMDDPATFAAEEVTLTKVDSSANAVTVARHGSETFTGYQAGSWHAGVTSLTLAGQGSFVILYQRGGNWRIKAAS